MSTGASYDELVRRIKRKRLVFTVTTGRSGTKYLARSLARVPGVTSRHEHWPEFAEVMRRVQQDRATAVSFLLERKLPAILAEPHEVYVETSHCFCKGFLEPLIDLGIVPDLVILRRPAREVASSMYRLGEIPGWSEWYLSPSDPGVRPMDEWYCMHDYQLCYWYCREIEGRMTKYRNLVQTAGGLVAETSLSDLTTKSGFSKLLADLQLPSLPEAEASQFEAERNRRVNAKRRDEPNGARELPRDLDRMEKDVDAWPSTGKGLIPPADLAAKRRPKTNWIQNVAAVRGCLVDALSRHASIVLIDDGRLPDYLLGMEGVIPFLSRNGRHWGAPEDDEQALAELERHMTAGVRTVLVTWSADWWHETYPKMSDVLHRRFPRRRATPAYELFEMETSGGL